ncbi:PDDEXK nuclease domain-containing protein [Herbiconiux sp. 11R-BC]|uniref:PDDEXK nuclease domain-containing protein n=1 Tax=Herbiconiux sp. 11R-BC TaxID=3111637 RepID=UPI003BFF305E
MILLSMPDDYKLVLEALKSRVRAAQMQAQRRVNTELIELYWAIGHTLDVRQTVGSWGTGVLNRVADDLRSEFPDMRGFSRSNLKYMRAFAQAWPESEPIGQQAAGQLPWGHIMVLLDRLDDRVARDWYAQRSVENGWSRSVLANQIMNRTLERTGSAVSNFDGELAPADSDLARQLAKDPYVFDFLDLTTEVAEKELEQALIDRMAETLRELGAGFAFVGRQVHFDVDGDDFYLDLLFFHVEQLRYVVIELKTGKFEPGHAGQLGFYVALVDDRLRREYHAPTVGILICGSGNEHTVRYSLGGTRSPLAVSTYTYESLPAEEKAGLPTADQLTAALEWQTK